MNEEMMPPGKSRRVPNPPRRRPDQEPDPIWDMIYTAVQHHMVTGSERPDLPAKAEGVDRVVVYAVAPDSVRLKVYMEDDSIRAFNLKLAEEERHAKP